MVLKCKISKVQVHKQFNPLVILSCGDNPKLFKLVIVTFLLVDYINVTVVTKSH